MRNKIQSNLPKPPPHQVVKDGSGYWGIWDTEAAVWLVPPAAGNDVHELLDHPLLMAERERAAALKLAKEEKESKTKTKKSNDE